MFNEMATICLSPSALIYFCFDLVEILSIGEGAGMLVLPSCMSVEKTRRQPFFKYDLEPKNFKRIYKER
jgi:hypothetical protein